MVVADPRGRNARAARLIEHEGTEGLLAVAVALGRRSRGARASGRLRARRSPRRLRVERDRQREEHEGDDRPRRPVTFSYPSGHSDHNADFGRGPQPTSCTQTAGRTPVGCRRSPTARAAPAGAEAARSRSGGLRLPLRRAPVHDGDGRGPGPAGLAVGRKAREGDLDRSRQRGTAVHGSVRLSRPAAGGALEVDLRLGGRRVGRLTKTPLKREPCASPSRSARRPSARYERGRLTLAVTATVRPRGVPVSVTRRVLLSSG